MSVFKEVIVKLKKQTKKKNSLNAQVPTLMFLKVLALVHACISTFS